MKLFIFVVIFSTVVQSAFPQTGPGGIGTTEGTSTLGLWLDASRGVSVNGSSEVTGISDLSGRSTETSIASAPILENSSFNGFPAILFDGIDDRIMTNRFIDAVSFPELTIVAVYRPVSSIAGSLWGEYLFAGDGWNGRFMTDNSLNAPITTDFVCPGYDPIDATHPSSNIPGLFPPGDATISSVVFREDIVNGTQVFVNGTLTRSFTSNHLPDLASSYSYTNLAIGSGSTSSSVFFNGYIAEFILYEHALSDTERIIVENYLSAKYDITLSSNDLYTMGEYSFYNEVVGIGQSVGIAHTTSNSNLLSLQNPSSLNDDDFLFIGHDGTTFQTTNLLLPVGVEARFGRLWGVSHIGDMGTVDIIWDLSGLGNVNEDDLVLLIDDDLNGSFANDTPIVGAINLGSNLFLFSNIALFNGQTFTLGTTDLNQTPLPVELKNFAVRKDKSGVLIEWASVTEINNEYFMVEKSDDYVVWIEFDRIDGAGNSTKELEYHVFDSNPFIGVSYYRLSQKDFDGTISILGTKLFEHRLSGQMSIFPNPISAGETMTFYGLRGLEIVSAELIQWDGKQVKLTFTDNSDQVAIPVDIKPGAYVISLQSKSFRYLYKLVVK
jgi:hypothetical protein